MGQEYIEHLVIVPVDLRGLRLHLRYSAQELQPEQLELFQVVRRYL